MSMFPAAPAEPCSQVPVTIAMEPRVEIYDIDAGADHFFGGSVEVDVSTIPAVSYYLHAFEVNFQSEDPNHHLNETANTASGVRNNCILFEKPSVVPNTAVYCCRFHLAIRSFLFPRNGQTSFFRVCATAVFALPGSVCVIRGPTKDHRFSLQVQYSSGSGSNPTVNAGPHAKPGWKHIEATVTRLASVQRGLHNCGMLGCEKQGDSYRLKLHLCSHFGVKPFTCEYCRREFSTPSNMKRHKGGKACLRARTSWPQAPSA